MDLCNECSAKGNIEKCVATTCSKHESWYAVQLQEQIKQLQDQLLKK